MLSRAGVGKNWWLTLTVLLFALTVLPATAPAVEKGVEPPDFELTSLEGEKVRLSDFRGRLIVLKLATTWCPSCKQQVKDLAKIETFLVDNNVALVEVYVDEPEDVVRKYLQRRDLKVPSVVVLDDGHVERAYRLNTIPRVILIDCDFLVRRDRGPINAADLQRRLEKMLVNQQ